MCTHKVSFHIVNAIGDTYVQARDINYCSILHTIHNHTLCLTHERGYTFFRDGRVCKAVNIATE